MKRLIGILATVVVISLGFAACDSGVMTDPDAAPELAAEGASNNNDKVLVCHVGNKLPEYDATCTEGCGDAGKVDLVEVPASVAEKHLANPDHMYGGVSDYKPGDDNGASGEGNEDTDGDGVDEGCEIPLPEISACLTDAISNFESAFGAFPNPESLSPWVEIVNPPFIATISHTAADGATYRLSILETSIYPPPPPPNNHQCLVQKVTSNGAAYQAFSPQQIYPTQPTLDYFALLLNQ